MNIDLAVVARDLKLPPEKLDQTVKLLDEGNTIPFITRFRKDQTGGLDENQILAVKQKVAQLRALAERKTFVLKSIDSQGKLTDELKTQLEKANTSRSIEDLYRPFKPRKQTRAATARQQGLEPLAEDILSGASADADLSELATKYVRVDKGLTSVDEVFSGVTDLLVEKFGEHHELRTELRRLVWTTGKLVSQAIPQADAAEPPAEAAAETQAEAKDTEVAEAATDESAHPTSETAAVEAAPAADAGATEPVADDATEAPVAPAENTATEPNAEAAPSEAPAEAQPENPAATTDATATGSDATTEDKDVADVTALFAAATEAAPAVTAALPKKKKKKKKKKKPVDDPFKDYHDFKQPVNKIPNYRVLAINRGERGGKLRVKIDADDKQLNNAAENQLVSAEHPFADFLKQCARESIGRVILPSLEREVRRELTETAEKHAVEVFANNLRSLLLQPPIRDCRVLAIDPGFKRGCSVAVLDAGGSLLDSGHVFVVGNKTRIDESGQKIADWVKQHQIDVISIGNGTACRHVEQLVSSVLSENLSGESKVRYVIVNEAGASIYSTSEIGREELPDASPSIRSAVSIGRRLQDPLSELVKISPANIGVGMYQHDVKAKHLSDSLDDVVQFCTNRIGVNVNSASPSLLKYVSGMNALTARRIYEHRKEHGPFKSRQQLRDVSGFGDATFLQAAGFLRIHDGESLLDATAIHPESYVVAESMMQKAGVDVAALFPPATVPATPAVPAADTPVPPPVVVDEAASAEPSAPDASEPVTPPTETEPVESQPASVEPEPPTTEEAAAPAAPPTPSSTPTPPAANVERVAAVAKLNELDVDAIAQELSTGSLLVKDIILALKKPDWDPRDRLSRPVFRSGIIKIEDLKPEMQLDAQVVNVVDFGVFVDIGLGESCLVHVSELSRNFIRDPHDHYAIGQVLKVWVSEIDNERRRVKLTSIRPGSKKPSPGGGRRRGKGSDSSAGESSGESRGPRTSGGGKGRSNRYEGSSQRGGGKGSRGSSQRSYKSDQARRKPAKPKPVKPITDQMLTGKEPMRSFSDLAQFVTKKPTDKKDDKSSDK